MKGKKSKNIEDVLALFGRIGTAETNESTDLYNILKEKITKSDIASHTSAKRNLSMGMARIEDDRIMYISPGEYSNGVFYPGENKADFYVVEGNDFDQPILYTITKGEMPTKEEFQNISENKDGDVVYNKIIHLDGVDAIYIIPTGEIECLVDEFIKKYSSKIKKFKK